MIFYGRRTTAQLELEKPLDCCCNCGRASDVDLVETPLRQTRFFLVFGTELELRDEFPYCRACRRSATRVRPGALAKLLMAGLTTSVLFLVIVMAESVLPRVMQASPFRWSLALGLAATYAYFGFRARRGSHRRYYQPVRLVEARLGEGRLQRLRLEFANAAYCRLFARANADRVAAGLLHVQAASLVVPDERARGLPGAVALRRLRPRPAVASAHTRSRMQPDAARWPDATHRRHLPDSWRPSQPPTGAR